MCNPEALIAGIIALHPLERGAELRRRLLDAWPDVPFGASYSAYEHEVDQAVADRECVDESGKLTFGVERKRYRR